MSEIRAPDRDPNALASALRALGAGAGCRVEARDALAVARAGADAEVWSDDTFRSRALAAARDHGFTHLALELTDDADDAGADAARVAAAPP